MEKLGEWGPCYADPYRGVAFFDGVLIECDPITETGQDRVLPVLEEEHIFVCRQIAPMLEKLGPGARVLDVNTGTGVSSIWAAKFGCQVEAVDVRHRALAVASENIKRNKHLLDAENITFKLLSSYSDLGDTEKFSDPFDLIILTLPYTPSHPAIPVATYGRGGEDGQAVFDQVVPHIARLLKEGGVCVGHQMSPVSPDKNLAESLLKIQRALDGRCAIRHTPLLNVGRYRTSDFLSGVYKNYLVDVNDKNDFAVDQEISEKLQGWINNFSCKYPKLEITYFEATKLTGSAEILEVIESITRSHKDWDWRIKLHREVVDHTSVDSSVSYTSLFLRTGSALQNLERRGKNLHSQDRKREKLSYKTSLLATFSDWVAQNELTDKGSADEHPLFDFIFVETLPFFSTPTGGRDMESESKVFLSKDICPDDEIRLKLSDGLLKAWQEVTINLQLANSGMATHEHFVGHDQKGGWANLTSTVWGAPFKNLTIEEKDFYGSDPLKKPLKERLFAEVNQDYKEVEEGNFAKERLAGIKTDRENGYLAIALNDIEIADVEELQKYWGGIETRIRNAGYKYNAETLRMDLEICHAAGHIHYQDAFAKCMGEFDCRKFKWSTKIAIPLTLGPSDIDEKDSERDGDNKGYKLPSGYRGGIWILAGSSRDWTLEHEAKLLDGVRLLWLLCNGEYNLQAAEKRKKAGELEAYIETSSALGHEVKHIIESLSSYWLIKPAGEVMKAVNSVTDEYGDGWKIAPMPLLIESTGRLFKLWARTNNPVDVFGGDLPTNMQELVESCWGLAKNALKPYVFSQIIPRGEKINQLLEINEFIDKELWAVSRSEGQAGEGIVEENSTGKFIIDVCGNMPSLPYWGDSRATMSREDENIRWMNFIRLLMAIFGNCIKHADHRRDITVTVTTIGNVPEATLEVRVSNYKDNGSKRDLIGVVQLAMQRVSTTSLSTKTSSIKIIRKCADVLGGEVFEPEEGGGGRYILTCQIPVRSLNSNLAEVTTNG